MKTPLHPFALLYAAALLHIASPAHAAPGDLDTTFGGGTGKVTTSISTNIDSGQGVAVQSDGKIVVAGEAYNGNDYDFALVRYTATGALDTSFGGGTGKVTTNIGSNQNFGLSVAVQSDGKIVVAGYSSNGSNNDFALVRYTATGALDTSFGGGTGKVTTPIGSYDDYGRSVAVQSDGKIVVAGYSTSATFTYDFALVRYTAAGALDTSFGTGTGKVTTTVGSGNNYGLSVAVQSDGKIVVAGYSSNGSNNDFALVRYTATGALDTSFGGGTGKVTTPIGSYDDFGYSVAVQSDGKIVVAGSSSNGSNNDFALVRYTATGALDTSFGGGTGKVVTAIGSGDDYGSSMAVQSDGKIVVAGASVSGFALARYTPTGALDTSFGGGTGKVTTTIGSSSGGRSVAVQSDGKIVVAGASANDFALARYLGDPADADGDGLLDSWEIARFGNITAHSALDDTDYDGRVELLEEAFGTDPLAPSAGAPAQAVVENGYLTMTVARRLGFAFTIESAGSPDGPAFSAATTTVLLDDGSTLKARDNFPIATNSQRYLRVKVTAAP